MNVRVAEKLEESMNRRFTSKKLAIALALATIPVLVGCGSSSSSTTTPIAGSYYESGGCIPITQPIYFSGTGVTLSSQSLVAGTIPAAEGGQTNGNIIVGTTPITNTIAGETFVSNDMSYGQYAYGDISVTLSGMTSGYYSSAGTIYGTVTISPTEQQQIEGQFAGVGTTYGTNYGSYGSIPCVSGLALQGYLDTTPEYPGFEGYAYVYIDNQPHGVVLQFSGVN
jgi:hypothetical protein